MKKHSIFFFDFDGTLADTRESLVPVYRAGFDLIGMHVSEKQCAHFMHHNLLETMQEMKVKPEDYSRFVQRIVEALDEEESLRLIKPFPEVEKILQMLHKRGDIMAVVSGNGSEHIALILNRFGWKDYFKTIIGSDMYKHGKPSPEPLLMGLSHLGNPDKSECIYVGDSIQDATAAKAAGLDYILVDRNREYDGKGLNIVYSLDEYWEFKE